MLQTGSVYKTPKLEARVLYFRIINIYGSCARIESFTTPVESRSTYFVDVAQKRTVQREVA